MLIAIAAPRGSEQDPAVDLRVQQVQQYLVTWLRDPDFRRLGRQAWPFVAERMRWTPRFRRWSSVWGPISGILTTLGELEWTLLGPEDWTAPGHGKVWSFADATEANEPVDLRGILADVQASVMRQLWAHCAANSYLSTGIGVGEPFLDQVRARIRTL